MILRPIWPIKLVFSDVLLLHHPSGSIWQKPEHHRYASTFTTTSFTRRNSRKPPPIRNLETFDISMRRSHTDSVTPPPASFSVSTFDPSALQPSDYLDVSNRRGPVVRLSTQGKSRRGTRLLYEGSNRTSKGFPPNTKGFFYLHKPPSTYLIQASKGAPINEITIPTHPAAGQLRFRLLDTPDPTRISEGRDLESSKAPYKPWGIRLIDILQYSEYRRLSEDLTSQAERDSIQAFVTRSRETAGKHHFSSFRQHTQVLDNILEPFVFDFSLTTVVLGLLDTDCIVRSYMARPCVVSATIPNFRSPYSGHALCRFEPAIRQNKEHTKAGLAIRVLKWLKHPNPTDVVVQEGGQLLKKCRTTDMEEVPAFINTDFFYIPPASMELLSKAFPIPNPLPFPNPYERDPRAIAA